MHVVEAKNVGAALYNGLRYLGAEGTLQDSRVGRVLVAPGPVVTTYTEPWDCFLTSPVRDANPFFHVAEALWMLSGRDDVDFLTPYVKDFGRFAEPDGRVHGAYGHRWRVHFGVDQLTQAVNRLKADPGTRQVVLQMWDAAPPPAADDMVGDWRDRPCNTQVYLRMRRGALDMTVTCRSNDIIMGAYGANAVHFAFLQQYVAGMAGVTPGRYFQLSNDYHAYVSDLQRLAARCGFSLTEHLATPRQEATVATLADRVSDGREYGAWYPLVGNPETFARDMDTVVRSVDPRTEMSGTSTPMDPNNRFLAQDALPALSAHWAHRQGMREVALGMAKTISGRGLRTACVEWLERRTGTR